MLYPRRLITLIYVAPALGITTSEKFGCLAVHPLVLDVTKYGGSTTLLLLVDVARGLGTCYYLVRFIKSHLRENRESVEQKFELRHGS